MKKILYIIGVMLALASCTDEEKAVREEGVTRQKFNVAIGESDDTPATRATVAMNRYLLEMYEGNLSAEPQKMSSTNGTFDVVMKKGVDYICFFWADNGTEAYDADNLKAVKQKDETKPGTAAYFANVTVNSNHFDGTVTLHRAVAELSFIDKNGLIETNNRLKITYPYASATMNLGDGTVTYGTGSTVERIIEDITPSTSPTDDAFATDFILAPVTEGRLAGLKLQLNEEEEKTIAETVVRANYRTKITGEYGSGPLPSMSFTIDTRNNNATDATFILPFQATLFGYTLMVDWGDNQTDKYPSRTALNNTNMTHTYATPGKYTVTITSTQTDYAQEQMPKLDFYYNYGFTNNNALKLVSLDTPLLNMGTNFAHCFHECKKLTRIVSGLFDKNPNATSFSYCFENTALTGEIPSGLFDKNTKATDFSYLFSQCTGLTGEIPSGLFNNNPEVKNFSNCFDGCSQLSGAIPTGLFDYNTVATDFSYCFNNCEKLSKAIPTGFFNNNTVVTSFKSCFAGCKNLTGAIPTGLFDNNTAVTSFSNCFMNCSNLTGAIPNGLFDRNIAVTSFSGCFDGCSKLSGAIPTGLFDNNIVAMNFSYCFNKCEKLSGDIPAGLFARNAVATDFSHCFSGCKNLTGAIPAGLFDQNPDVTSFSYCFSDCEKLTRAIPDKLFAKNGDVTSFQNCFNGCIGLTEPIPSGLFENNTKVTDFSYCFFGCKNLTGVIPTRLFDKNTAVTNFASCFSGCKKLTGGIPAKLFDKNPDVTSFKGCFNNCIGLTEPIPSGLFNNNTKVTDFSNCFMNCEKLSGEIPAGLFAKNTAATNFSACFNYCKTLVPTADIFCNEAREKKTRFAGKTMNFDQCFYNCSESSGGGTFPELWNYTMGTGSSHIQCFREARANNLKDIPGGSGWI